MHNPLKRITDIGQTGLIIVALAMTWAIPAGLSATLSPPTSTVDKGQRDHFEGDKRQVEYEPPVGWTYIGQGNSDVSLYQNGKRTLHVEHITGAEDIPTTIKRQVRKKSTGGILITLEDQQIKTSTNFTGKRCRAGTPLGELQGSCAMFGQKGSLVFVMSLAENGTRPLDIDPIVDSFTFKEISK
ncbi:hypothetical protein [Austwickia chelonae]|uniref:hypothetical protein n=1 Tax=Austwickia chelonae TaxID=100225 RepID=UPI000E255852|nr:hypothetical protein [Austwickia chelonae]